MNFQIRFFTLLTLLLSAAFGWAQPKLELNMKKPKQFEERQLGSEKMAEKKFTPVRHLFQNAYTHYNYYFNANEKLNSIVEYARQGHKDDYTELLSFYPYSLDVTSRSGDIDSILQTATAGILLHDLRNDWIDNLYLVMGKAYMFRKDYDSALMSFQYLNYSYAPKEKGGFDQPIGSNAVEGSNALSISSKEKTNLAKKVFTKPPSRNESFVWMIRTLTEQGNYLDASSLVSTLRNDPVFPERLKETLMEHSSYLFYKVEQWDSAAAYLEQSMSEATDLSDRARRWYLAGQLYQLAHNADKAVAAFEMCTKTAVDPVMEIYARLNTIRLRKSEDPSIIDQNIADLMSLAKKEKYVAYRDIIYYAAAMFEVERNGYENADGYLKKSILYNEENPEQRSQSFMLMGDVRYNAKRYGAAALPYDSAVVTMLKSPDSLRVEQRKPGTKIVYTADNIIFLQDSLLQIAAMPEDQRNEYVKALSKRLRKERGLKEDIAANTSGAASAGSSTTDLFSTGQGTWYFYDANRRSSGFLSFRQKWSDRPNVDNWRRSAAISIANKVVQKPTAPEPEVQVTSLPLDETEKWDTTDISFDNLYSRLPISDEKKLRANNRIILAMYLKATALHEKIEDYPEAIKVYEDILKRMDTGRIASQSLFALIHCYTKVGNAQGAADAKRMLQKQFPNDNLTALATKGVDPTKAKPEENKAATALYQQVYGLYLEGSFDKALALKKKADSTYGKNYWTPQLLYIETVYQLQQKQDSLAMKNLDEIITQFPDHPLAAKAKVIKEVLPKRKEIETYLSELDVTRAQESKVVMPATVEPKSTTATKTNAPKTVVPTAAPKPVVDSSAVLMKAKPAAPAAPYAIDANGEQVVAIVLENIDPAYVNEANYSLSNSPKRNNARATVTIEKKKLKDKLFLLVIRSPYFSNATTAYEYIDYLKPIAAKEILSWLDTKKYHFTMLSEENLNLLMQDPKLELYESILKQTFPGKF